MGRGKEEHKSLLTGSAPRDITGSDRRYSNAKLMGSVGSGYRRGSMVQSSSDVLGSSADASHVFVDINSPNFKTTQPQKEEQIINSLRKNYLNTYMGEHTPSVGSYSESRKMSVGMRPNSLAQTQNDTFRKDDSAIEEEGDVESVKPQTPDLDNDPNLSTAGGDITRDIYKTAHKQLPTMVKRMQSTDDASLFSGGRRQSTASALNVPGGFRREFIVNKKRKEKVAHTSSAASEVESAASHTDPFSDPNEDDKVPFLTKNFLEFLYMYGHFAGESFEDDFYSVDGSPYAIDETRNLLETTRSRLQPQGQARGTTSTRKVFFLLLKSFVGTGVLFLPNAFNNGGLMFSIGMLAFFGAYSYLCYYLLISSKIATNVRSFGQIGLKLYGPYMKYLILFSLVITQLGFSSAYVIFTAKNLKAIAEHVFNLPNVSMTFFMVIQLVLFIPLSFVRKISKLSLPSLFANVFILIGLIIVLFFTMKHLFIDLGGHAAEGVILGLNTNRWTLFIGTAIFSFEGIGLVIPVQESMRKPEKFPMVLGLVIVTSTLIFITVATIGYLAYGSAIETVILLNLPQKNILVSVIQLLYSFAIMLSTPLQMFPAIKIIENGLFRQYKRLMNKPLTEDGAQNSEDITGKSSMKVKWIKNVVRTLVVVFVVLLACLGADNLDKFVSIIGSFACIPLVYMYPPMLHLKSISLPMSNGSMTSKRSIFDFVLIIFGGISMIYTSYQSLFATE
ncbi:Vacuolar amino acid transporter 4 [Nakaseomyces bracarensis]|uniref:Vacuolar amino acid transporter 4 n=1 Tax=Nakaseomyces bracarensis TaxID=273131 RepID=A0ABR4NML6_9SACH